MAGFNTINAHDADVRVPAFLGLAQYGDPVGGDPRYAKEAKNVETIGGILQPCASCTLLAPSLPSPIETLCRLYRRWHTTQNQQEVLVAASGGQLYYCLPDTAPTEWTKLPLPADWAGTSYQSNDWSWAAYEINPVGSTAPIDVLLLSNAKDGMISLRGDTMTVGKVKTPKKFGVIARYAERIWGGAIPDDPDMLVYSAPYDPFDWAANTKIPEDGAGDVQQPSWDGDSFSALCQFGQQLIAFKKTRIWRILGTDPGEYSFKEQYGGGAPYERTIAIDGERILMLGTDGVYRYDGLSVMPFYQEYASDIFARLNLGALDNAFGCVWRGKYYVSLPLDNSQSNNAVLIYDTKENTWLLRDDVSVEAFLPTETALYFTSASTPGRIWLWGEDSWKSGSAVAGAKWVSPWNDLNFKQLQKGGYELYVTVEAQADAELVFTIQTEKKSKSKTYLVSPPDEGKGAKQKVLRFGGSARRFRLMIECSQAVPWRIVGGLLIVTEIDPD